MNPDYLKLPKRYKEGVLAGCGTNTNEKQSEKSQNASRTEAVSDNSSKESTETQYFLQNYNIDTHKVYASGYSGGGETMSLVMGKRPKLFTAFLQCSSKWDGAYDAVISP